MVAKGEFLGWVIEELFLTFLHDDALVSRKEYFKIIVVMDMLVLVIMLLFSMDQQC